MLPRRTLIALTTVAAGIVASTQVAAADPLYVCTVTSNGVNFRTGPGTQYRSLGKVNAGQKMDVYHNQQNPVDGWWQNGTLWGGPSNVWIRQDYCH